MAKKEFKPLFGLNSRNWNQIDYASTILIAGVMTRKGIQMLGDHQLLGGASSLASKANFGMKNKTWDRFDDISTALYALILIHGAVDAYEERRNIPSDKQLIPGKGLVYRTYEEAKAVF